MEIIAKGAEAIIFKKEADIVVKRRIEKGYRIKEIDDKLRKQRTRFEARILEKAGNIINVPKLLSVDESTKEIEISFILGKKLSDDLNSMPLQEQEKICKQIGEEISKLHDENIIHGDLTTSNMILSKKESSKENFGCLYFIDFGLGFHSSRDEDKAVDLHLIKQALEAKHYEHFKVLFDKIIEGYKTSENSEKILKQLEKVEKRGRYRH